MRKALARLSRTITTLLVTIVLAISSSSLGFLPRVSAVIQERTLSSGIADASGVQGVKWRKVSMTAAQTGMATFKLAWTGTADMRFQVLRSDNSIIGGNISASTTSPKTYSTNLTANTSYYVTIWAYSGVGNFVMTVAEDFPDTTAPSVPSTLVSPSRTSSSVSLSWAASTDDVGVTGYLVYRNALLVGSPATTSYTDTGLTENTSYTYTVRAVDAAGNQSLESSPLTVTTLTATPDTTAPTTPTNLRSTTQTHNSLSLAWDASTDDVGVSRYRVYRDSALIGSPTTATYTDTGLAAQTTYSYEVEAVDPSNNASARTAALPVTTQAAPVVSARPNIIVINLDDMRTDSMIALPKVKAWMESGGTNFPNATVATPSCCPSRASLMTGRYVHNNGQYNQDNVGADMNLMVQRYLKDSGYFTGHSGKFLHWLSLGTRAPHWDRWTYYKGGYTNVQMRMDDTTVTTSGYATTIAFDRAIEYTRDFKSRDDARPFFIQLAPTAPHSPSTPEAKYETAFVPTMLQKPSHTETDRTDKPNFVSFTNETYTQGNSKRTAMHRALYSVDDSVDKLMKELQAQGELDNTMVIFTADNGYFFGEHGRGGKFLPYYESVGVPFYVRWPGQVNAGSTDLRRVSHVDITPTILAAANTTQSLAPVDGKDILSGYSRPYAYSEYYYDTANANYITTWASMSNDQFVYTEYYGQSTSMGTTPSFREYYDMVNDPYQMTNLLKDGNASNDPDVAPLSATLGTIKNCSGASCQ